MACAVWYNPGYIHITPHNVHQMGQGHAWLGSGLWGWTGSLGAGLAKPRVHGPGGHPSWRAGGGPDPQLSPSSERLFLETWGRGATPKMLFLKWAFPEPASSTSPKICSKKVQNQTCLLQPRGWGPHNMLFKLFEKGRKPAPPISGEVENCSQNCSNLVHQGSRNMFEKSTKPYPNS